MKLSHQMVTSTKFIVLCSISPSSFSLLSFCWPSSRVSISDKNYHHFEKGRCKFPLQTGLIIDAFGELRDQLASVSENLESECFICGIGKDYFDSVPHGFDTHVQKEHNLANYL